MQLKPFSAVALSKALATCDGDLAILVLLHSYEALVLEDLRGGSSVLSAASGVDKFSQFYAYLRDPPAEGGARGAGRDAEPAPRGVLREQAYDVWHGFVLSMFAALPNVALVRCRPAFPSVFRSGFAKH